MSRYSGGQDNEFWLRLEWGIPYTVERMKRSSINVDLLAMTRWTCRRTDSRISLLGHLKETSTDHVCRVLFRMALRAADRPRRTTLRKVEPELFML